MSIVFAVVDVRRGSVIRYLGPPREDLEPFGALLPELFAVERGAWAYGAFERAQTGSSAELLADLLFVGPETVHVAHRLPWRREQALIAIGRWESNVGVVLSATRDALHELEREAER